MNCTIQLLNGWNSLTLKSLSQVISFDLSSCLLRSSVHMVTHLREVFWFFE